MKTKKEKSQKFYVLLQMQKSKLSYYMHLKDESFDSLIMEHLDVHCKTILSDYKSIKIGDEVKVVFRVEPYLKDEKCDPKAFGYLLRENKQYCFHVCIPDDFLQRVDFILNRGLLPYFYLSCEKENYKHADIKIFSLESEVVLEDYIS